MVVTSKTPLDAEEQEILDAYNRGEFEEAEFVPGPVSSALCIRVTDQMHTALSTRGREQGMGSTQYARKMIELGLAFDSKASIESMAIAVQQLCERMDELSRASIEESRVAKKRAKAAPKSTTTKATTKTKKRAS